MQRLINARCLANALHAVTGIAIPGFPQHAVAVRYATEHRCGVVVRGAGLCDAITGTDPLRDNLPLQVRTLHSVQHSIGTIWLEKS